MKNQLTINMYRTDIYLFAIFIMLAIAIIARSYFHLDGYLSPDSTKYLGLAQNLLNGNGYHVPAYGITGQDKEFFAIWPIGYPTLIFIIAKITTLSVFWAAKLLNIVLIAIILSIFRTLFKQHAYIYGLILLFSSYIEIFTYTWSETMFITTLLWFATSIYFFITSPQKTLTLYFSLMIASLLLFVSRYIGAFSFGLIGLLGLYYAFIKKEKFIATMLIGIAILNTEIMVLYLHYNYIETGFITGMQRIASHETNIELFYMLLNAIFAEILIITTTLAITTKSIIIFILQISIFSFFFWRYRQHINSKQNSIELASTFIIVASIYLFFIILMRWMTQFDQYSYRLLAPGNFLIFIAIISIISQRASTQFFNIFKNLILSFAIFSFLFNVPYKIWESTTLNPIYTKAIEPLKNKFSNLEKNSMVIFAPMHIKYLYSDIKIKEPHSFPYSLHKETWSEFMQRIDIKNKQNIYLYIPKQKPSPKEFDQSVIDFVNKYDEETVVKLK